MVTVLKSYHDFSYFPNSFLLTFNRTLDIEGAIRIFSVDSQCCPRFLFYVAQMPTVFSNNCTHIYVGYEVQLFP